MDHNAAVLPDRSPGEAPLSMAGLHHMAVVARDLDRACAFYEGVLGLRRLPRPAFPVGGFRYAAGALEVHIAEHPGGSFRGKAEVDPNDIHFALRVADFEGALRWLAAKGYRGGPLDHPQAILVKRGSVAGYRQACLLDPDLHLIEIDAAL